MGIGRFQGVMNQQERPLAAVTSQPYCSTFPALHLEYRMPTQSQKQGALKNTKLSHLDDRMAVGVPKSGRLQDPRYHTLMTGWQQVPPKQGGSENPSIAP